MKDVLTKYFGVLGLLVYYPIALIVRIPVFIFLLLFITFVLLIWNPLTGKDRTAHWVNRLYDWYCGK